MSSSTLDALYYGELLISRGAIIYRLIETCIDYFLPSHFVEYTNMDTFLYGRVNVGGFLCLLFIIIPIILFNSLVLSVPFHRLVVGGTVLTLSLTGLYLYRSYPKIVLQRQNEFSLIQVLILLMCIGYLVFESGTFMNSGLFWVVAVVITLSFYSDIRGFLLTFFMSFLLIFLSFILLEVNLFEWSNVEKGPKFLVTDLIGLLLYTFFISLIYRSSKKFIYRILQNQKQELDFQRKKRAENIKNSTLAKMAASLAHEINNPIFSTQGEVHAFKSMVQKGELDASKTVEMIESIENKLIGVSKIIRGVSVFARERRTQEREYFYFHEVFDEALNFCYSRIKSEEVKFHQSIDKNIVIYGDRTTLIQVVVNLLTNALDGLIGVEKKEIEVRSRFIGKVVEILFIDSGVGINPSVEDQIFEPFFTTKDFYSGTGLGLSISRSIAREHGGNLFYEKRNSKTCFVLILSTTKNTLKE